MPRRAKELAPQILSTFAHLAASGVTWLAQYCVGAMPRNCAAVLPVAQFSIAINYVRFAASSVTVGMRICNTVTVCTQFKEKS